MNTTLPNRWRPSGTDLGVLLVLLLAGIKYTFGLGHVLDIELYDESGYLHAGAALRQVGFPPAPFAPLYAIWYYALSLAQPDLVRLYYLNYALTTVLPPLFLYVLLRVNRVAVVTAAVVAAYFLITQANFRTWPRPSHFALLIALASLALAVGVRRASTGLLLLAVGAILASFVRPEFFLSFLLLLAAGTSLLVAEHRRGAAPLHAWWPLGGVVLAAAGLLGVFGLPAFGRGGGDRHFFAFAQHFALNWANWNHLGPDNAYNPATNFREIAAKFFGNAQTVAGAARHNPAVFAHHVFTNVRSALSRFPGLFLHHEDIFLPLGTACENLEARLTLVALAMFVVIRRKTWWPALGANVRRHRRLLICAALLCVPGAISIAEIFPNDHYMLVPGTLLIVAAVVLLQGREEIEPPSGLTRRGQLLLALGILAVTPALSHRPDVDTPIVRTIRAVQALGIRKPVHLLEAEGGYDYYLPANYQRVAEYDKTLPFDQFLSAAGINMVAWTELLSRDSRFATDPTYQAFLDHYREAGFEAHPVPGGGVTLLVRRDLLPVATGVGP